MHCSTFLILLASPLLALAKDGTSGCTSTIIGNNVVFYVDGTGEICDYPADCGGGRAPPKYSVPGCPAYTGTETRPARYIPGYGPNAAATPAPVSVAAVPAAVAALTGTSVAMSPSGSAVSPASISTSGASSRVTTASPSLSSAMVTLSVASTSTLRASNITTPSAPGTGSFNGEAGRVGAQIGLVAFFGAVLALF